MSEESKFHQEYLNRDSCQEDIVSPRRETKDSLLASGNVRATILQQQFHPLWQRLLSPIHLLCTAIAGAHHAHQEAVKPSGSPLIQRESRKLRRHSGPFFKPLGK